MPGERSLNPFVTQRAIFNNAELSSTETLVALALLANRYSKTGECRPKVSMLCRQTRLCERVVRKAIKGLETKNVIAVVRSGKASDYTFIEAESVGMGASNAGLRGASGAWQTAEEVHQMQDRGAPNAGRSLNIEEQSFSKENPSHAHTCAHAREDEPAPWEEAEKQPDPEDLEDLTPETISQRDLEESDRLFQKDIFDEPGTVERVARRCPYGAIKNLYHTILPELEPIRIDTRDRIRRVCVVWRELVNRQGCVTVNDGLKQVEAYFRKVRRSRIYDKAARNELKWQVDFSWLTKAETLVKVLEGGYD